MTQAQTKGSRIDHAKAKGGASKIDATSWMKMLGLLAGGGGILVTRDWIVANPLSAGALFVAATVLGVAARVVGKIAGRLEEPWIARATSSVDFWLDCAVSGHRRRYLRHLVHRHRDFDVKGLTTLGPFSLELQKVFVELRIEPTALGKLSADPLHRSALAGGAHNIWDFLLSSEPGFSAMAVLGPPGSGKTTLLKHVALVLAASGKAPKHRRPSHRLPVLIFLRDLVPVPKDGIGLDLAQAAYDSARLMENHRPPLRWFEQRLEKDEAIILLDGFDEVADAEQRIRISRWIERQIKRHGGNRFVITSRPMGYRTCPVEGVTVLEVQPFTDEQVRRFIASWYLATEIMAHGGKEDEGVRLKAREGTRDLVARLHQGPGGMLADLSVNPLLLTMVATVHRYRSSLPGRRVELFAEICEVFLGKRKQAAGIEDTLTPAQRQLALQPLAYQMMLGNQREIASQAVGKIITPVLKRIGWKDGVQAFLRDVEARSGLLLERENDRWAFAHLSFQEYLAATDVATAKDPKVGDALPSRIDESWWHETLRLYAAQTDGSAIVDACLANDPVTPRRLVLAQEIVEEAKELREGLKDRVQRVIDEGLESSDLERFRLAAEARITRRLTRMERIDDERWIDPDLITHAEYQLFIDERAAALDFRQPDHWITSRFRRGTARDPVLGVRASDAREFGKWLAERGGGKWNFRIPTEDECARHPLDMDYGQPVRWWCGVTDSDEAVLSEAMHPEGWSLLGLTSRSVPLSAVLEDVLAPQWGEVGEALPFSQQKTWNYFARLLRGHPKGFDRRFDLDLNHSSESEIHLARAYALARVLAYDLNLAHDLTRETLLSHARNSAKTRDPVISLDRAINFDHARDRALALASALSLARHRHVAHTLGVALALASFAYVLAEMRSVTHLHDYRDGGDDLNKRLEVHDLLSRALALMEIYARDAEGFHEEANHLNTFKWRRSKRTAENPVPQKLTFDDAIAALCILRMRRVDELKPFEGIRLVRERVPGKTDDEKPLY